MNTLTTNQNIKCAIPGGAFYVFPDFSYYLNSQTNGGKLIKTASDLSLYFLEETGVVSVAGDSFGAPGYIRFSYATDNKTIETAISLVYKALEKLIF